MIQRVGLQTFTIRNDLKTIEDIEQTIMFYANQGIKQFELSYIKFSKEELAVLKKLQQNLGITYTACQITMKRIIKEFNYLIDFCKTLDVTYLEVSVIPINSFLKGKQGIVNLAERLNQLGKRTKEHDIHLLFHHHNYELIKLQNQLSLDILMDNTDSQYVNFVCDTYWIARSGFDPAAFIGKRINRVKGLHLRDNHFYYKNFQFKYSDALIGDGTIDFESIIELDKAGLIDFYSIEQNTDNPGKDVIKSYQYLQKLINH